MDERMAQPDGGLLVGRRTYEDLLGYWNSRPDSPSTPAFDDAPTFRGGGHAGGAGDHGRGPDRDVRACEWRMTTGDEFGPGEASPWYGN